ncbi:triple tyrosine motif-containing protein [Clostridium septicum]|uniref:triple tyrosine motif-containing protein n=1 Tax=Clostridium septicum TaxID=1504 RepID=UPI00272EA202|nr:triple tyrosine motif-containing protein [Clostridium septicum]WLF68988.1 triple tyrosine motif-containing protein [Clostridium septicum]
MKFKLLNNLKKISLMLCFTMLFQMAGLNFVKTHAAENAKLTYSIKGETKIGNTVDIFVNISNISNLYGGSVDFLYDPSLLNIQSIEVGDIFKNQNIKTPVKKIANGQANLAFTLTGIKDGVKGNGTIAVIKAKILKAGAINLKTTTKNDALKVNGNNVRVKLVNSNEKTITYASEEKSISSLGNPVKVNSVSVDKASPQTINTPVTFTAKASGGSSILYQFWINDGKGWKMVRNYSSSNTFTWKPTVAGNYTVSVYAKDSKSTKLVDDAKLTNYVVSAPGKPVKIDSVSMDKASPQAINTPVTFTAKASGGSSILYQFWINDGKGWKMVRNYSSSNTFTWKPTVAGNYTVSVYAKDSKSAKAADDVKLTNYVISASGKPVKIDSVSMDKASPQAINTPVTFTAKASGGSSILYQFWINDGKGWKMVRNYSNSNTFTWKPTVAGKYSVSVYAKDSKSTKAADDIKITNYVISASGKPVKIDSVSMDKASPQAINTPVTFTAKASGGSSILYQFWINDGKGWKMVRNYSNSNTFTWKPTATGNYTVSVYAKDSTSAKAADDIKLTSYVISVPGKPVKVDSVSIDKASPQVVGTPITFTAKASGGSSILYQFWINDGKGWKMVRNYSNSNTFTWKPATAGTYTVSVYAKDSKSTKAADDLKMLNYTISNKK